MLSKSIKHAMSLYYAHRDACNSNYRLRTECQKTGKPIPEKVGWDKEGDLNVIFEIARNEGFKTSASAGTFWFSSETEQIKADESDYLEGGESTPVGKPFGFFADVEQALNKRGKSACFINADEHGGLKNTLTEVILQKVAEKTAGDPDGPE